VYELDFPPFSPTTFPFANPANRKVAASNAKTDAASGKTNSASGKVAASNPKTEAASGKSVASNAKVALSNANTMLPHAIVAGSKDGKIPEGWEREGVA